MWAALRAAAPRAAAPRAAAVPARREEQERLPGRSARSRSQQAGGRRLLNSLSGFATSLGASSLIGLAAPLEHLQDPGLPDVLGPDSPTLHNLNKHSGA